MCSARGSCAARARGGGFTPTATFIVRTERGTTAFVKAVRDEPGEFGLQWLRREQRFYVELGPHYHSWIPRVIAATRAHGWELLVLTDVGRATAPPWSASITGATARQIARVHAVRFDVPSWLHVPSPQVARRGDDWQWWDAEHAERVARLAGRDSIRAARWLSRHVPDIVEIAAQQPTDTVVLHGDLRSDNLRLRAGQLLLLDWPFVHVGARADDIVMLAQSACAESGVDPELFVSAYADEIDLPPHTVTAAVARAIGVFAFAVWQPPPTGLPRLRGFQVRQLQASLYWFSARTALPRPDWCDSLDPVSPVTGMSFPRLSGLGCLEDAAARCRSRSCCAEAVSAGVPSPRA